MCAKNNFLTPIFISIMLAGCSSSETRLAEDEVLPSTSIEVAMPPVMSSSANGETSANSIQTSVAFAWHERLRDTYLPSVGYDGTVRVSDGCLVFSPSRQDSSIKELLFVPKVRLYLTSEGDVVTDSKSVVSLGSISSSGGLMRRRDQPGNIDLGVLPRNHDCLTKFRHVLLSDLDF